MKNIGRPLQVGDWCRVNGCNGIYRIGDIHSQSARLTGAGIVRLEDCTRVIVRDVTPPRRVRTSELWAWLAENTHRAASVGPWDLDSEHERYAVYDCTMHPVAYGHTPLKAIVAARKAVRKAAKIELEAVE